MDDRFDRKERSFNRDGRSYGRRNNFGGRRTVREDFGNENLEERESRPRDFKPRNEFKPRRNFEEGSVPPRPRAEDVAVAMSDAGSAPQVAVGGVREVFELVEKEPMRVHRILFKQNSGDSRLYALQKAAKKAHIHVQQVETRILDSYARPNQGVVALCNEKTLLQWEEISDEFMNAKDRGEKKLIAVATNIEDPRNLGACIRSALGLGVDLLMIPAKGMCGITPTVAKTSAGALEKMRICRPENLEATVSSLRLAGYQVLGLDANTETNLAGFDFAERVVLAVGGEDVGLPPFIAKQCDAILRIPMKAEAQSYNASVALSLGLYEWARKNLK